jgi:hypothetical protein
LRSSSLSSGHASSSIPLFRQRRADLPPETIRLLLNQLDYGLTDELDLLLGISPSRVGAAGAESSIRPSAPSAS